MTIAISDSFSPRVKNEHTFVNFIYDDLVKINVLIVGAERSLGISEEILPNRCFTRLLHERVISVYATTGFVELDEGQWLARSASVT